MFFPFEPRPSRFRLGRFYKCRRSPIRERPRVGSCRLLNGFLSLLVKLPRCMSSSGFHMAGHLICRVLFRRVFRRRSAALRLVLCSDKSILHALGSHGGLVYGLYRPCNGIACLDISHRVPLRTHPRRGALSSACRALCPSGTG